MADLRIGISGWRYAGWRNVFYPSDLPQRRELAYVSSQLNSLEINGSFYSLQTPESYARWRAETEDDFVFAVKGPRFITHMLQLRNAETALANFFASGVLRLAEKLGPCLWQFPPRMRFDPERFETFLRQLPRTTDEAAALARRHSDKVAGRAWTEAEHDGRIRHCLEVRHPSFSDPAFVEMLHACDVALVFADSAGLYPYAEDLTSDFVYVRLHGAESLYESGYTDEQLDWWAERIRTWRGGGEPADAARLTSRTPPAVPRHVYAYFDNDRKVYAPFDAMRLAERLR